MPVVRDDQGDRTKDISWLKRCMDCFIEMDTDEAEEEGESSENESGNEAEQDYADEEEEN